MALLRLESFAMDVRALGSAGRCSHPPGFHPPLQGRDRDGSFRTSIAKIYPPRLNALLAKAICLHAKSLGEVIPPVEPVDPTLFELTRTDFVADRRSDARV